MRILKKCRKKKCNQLFNAIEGDNLIMDKNGSFRAICPWCKHSNTITKSERRNLTINRL
jgi:hypothetical protein